MKPNEQKKAAKKFVEYWKDKGYEKGESQPFWLSLLRGVFGVEEPEKFIQFENPVLNQHMNFIDAYIPASRVMIEQKSRDKDLRKGVKQSDGSILTPFQQAKKYITNLPLDLHPRYIITCNFQTFLVYDMQRPLAEPAEIRLADLEKDYYRLAFIAESGEKAHLKKELELSVKAGELVGKLYDALEKQYADVLSGGDPKKLTAEVRADLNKLCVRLVFCFYAEDAGVFGAKDMFHDYLAGFKAANVRDALIKLFSVLDTPEAERDPFDKSPAAAFPYVNGGLFGNCRSKEVPPLTEEIVGLILNDCCDQFDWSEISPTIFGAVFESTLNPETRRAGGMHYTSIENIHKVIDPLFLDELKAELERIKALKIRYGQDSDFNYTRRKALQAFQEKLSSLTFLDPAAGSGNFLTETYLCLRRLENDVLNELYGEKTRSTKFDKGVPVLSALVLVSIRQFYGIEINDFAVSVAKTALWIAESQMWQQTQDIINMGGSFLPLKTNANIVEGNALRLDWKEIVPPEKLDYIMGNPPFVGQAMRTKEQAQDMQAVFAPLPNGGKLDYVGGWFKKASDFIMNTQIKVAFVASNSICQGESVNLLWEMLLTDGIVINFAHTSFKWTNEAKDQAAVYCVIVGFARINCNTKFLFTSGSRRIVNHINGYLNAAPDVFIKNRSKSINSALAKVVQGSPPADDGRLLLSAKERDDFLAKYPELNEVIRPFVGSREFINDIKFSRYCFWFDGVSPAKFKHIPELLERFNYVREYRLKSPVDRIQKTANTPFLFTQNRQPTTDYLFIPRVSSERRKYIPIGFLPPTVIASDSAVVVYNAGLYDFGMIASNVHNAWMRTIAGRLKSDYRYAPSVYYNFPFPAATEQQRAVIERAAQAILEARKLYPQNSLADMYGDEMYMYPELLNAHQENDKAVMTAYGLDWRSSVTSESDCVAELFRLYEKLTAQEANGAHS